MVVMRPCGHAIVTKWSSCLLTAIVVLGGHKASGDTALKYSYRSYKGILRYFRELERKHPDIVQTWIAQDAFPHILPDKSKPWATCDGEVCQTLVVRVASKQNLTSTTPEVFFSGALHGDERVGPATLVELAGFLCREYKKKNEFVRHMLDSRSTWLMPITNAEGYAKNSRFEKSMDPNRDFAYLQKPSMCMRTQTARAVNELFRQHLFQFMITFHGGMRCLTYEWGSKNHLKSRSKASEAPDDQALVTVGKSLQAASGKTNNGYWWYPLGRITDIVYYVDGGMEDWSYAAGWERSPDPITGCRPETYGGYDPQRTQYRTGSIATAVYLAETDDAKRPSAANLGSESELWSFAGIREGHVPRNMRMCLRLMQLVVPEVVVMPPTSWPRQLLPSHQLSLQVRGIGCLTLNSARFLLVPISGVDGCATLSPPHDPGGTSRTWTEESRSAMLNSAYSIADSGQVGAPCVDLELSTRWRVDSTVLSLRGRVPANVKLGLYCAVVAAEFDQDWRNQLHPDPKVQPRTHVARGRIEEHYRAFASDGEMRIDEYRTKLFPVLTTSVAVVRDEATDQGFSVATVPVAQVPAHVTRPPLTQQYVSSPKAAPEVFASVGRPAGGTTAALLVLVGVVCLINAMDAALLARSGRLCGLLRGDVGAAKVVGRFSLVGTDDTAAAVEEGASRGGTIELKLPAR